MKRGINKNKKQVSSPKLTKLIKVTPGGNQAWFETDMGFKVRKPRTKL